MSKNWTDDIIKMHRKFGVDKATSKMDNAQLGKFLEFRAKFLQEEYEETMSAIAIGDAEEVVDGLIDLCVVAIGTLDVMNVDASKAWDAVLNANMAKQPGIKPERPNPLGLPDMIKPEGWTAPSHEDNHGILGKALPETDLFKKEVRIPFSQTLNDYVEESGATITTTTSPTPETIVLSKEDYPGIAAAIDDNPDLADIIAHVTKEKEAEINERLEAGIPKETRASKRKKRKAKK